MTTNEIIENLNKDQVIETIAHNLRVDSEFFDDLVQEIYLIVLQYDNEKLNDIWSKGQIKFWLSRVMMNTWNSRTSRFFKTYKKYGEHNDRNKDLGRMSASI
jgi:hypothetical protein